MEGVFMAEKPEQDSFLAGLDAKIAALQSLRDSYVSALSVGALGQGNVDVSALMQTTSNSGTPTGQPASVGGPIELPTGVFRNKGLSDAIRTYLSIARRKQTTKEIAAALKEGGLASTATDFERNLRVTLYRLKDAGELLNFKDGWDLASSYPESFRQRMVQNSDSTPKRKRKRKRRTATSKVAKIKKVQATKNESEPALRAV